MANTVSNSEGRQTESVPVLLTAAGVEAKQIALEGKYGAVDFLDVEINVTKLTETPKIKVALEDSVDGGVSYFATEGFTETAELAEAKTIARIKLAEKPHGSLLRLNFKFGAKGGVEGVVTVATSLTANPA